MRYHLQGFLCDHANVLNTGCSKGDQKHAQTLQRVWKPWISQRKKIHWIAVPAHIKLYFICIKVLKVEYMLKENQPNLTRHINVKWGRWSIIMVPLCTFIREKPVLSLSYHYRLRATWRLISSEIRMFVQQLVGLTSKKTNMKAPHFWAPKMRNASRSCSCPCHDVILFVPGLCTVIAVCDYAMQFRYRHDLGFSFAMATCSAFGAVIAGGLAGLDYVNGKNGLWNRPPPLGKYKIQTLARLLSFWQLKVYAVTKSSST